MKDSKIIKLMKTINSLQNKVGLLMSIEELEKEANLGADFKACLKVLKRHYVIFEPAKGFIQKF